MAGSNPFIQPSTVRFLHAFIRRPTTGTATSRISPIRVVACNLYPFGDAAATVPPLSDDALLEMIDIGGPTMVRASAKNHRHS